MKSLVIKRSIVLAGHKTSVSLEDAFWRGIKDIAASRRTTLSDLVASIDTERKNGNLSWPYGCLCSTTIQEHGSVTVSKLSGRPPELRATVAQSP